MHNINIFNASGTTTKPEWNPEILREPSRMLGFRKLVYRHYSDNPVYLVENALSNAQCNDLIGKFNDQVQYPVGVDGYANPLLDPGSHRAMAWSPDIAGTMTRVIHDVMNEHVMSHWGDRELLASGSPFATPFETNGRYELLGSTPWLRFMKYANGGMHTPHYDAPFHNEEERYITMFSWVLYLNTPIGTGGNFQFVRDGQDAVSPVDQNRNDWTEMSEDIAFEITPEGGRLLIFPHWLCHQVQKFTGFGHRYIIRGDVAYGY